MNKTITVLPGDGIGPEVTCEAVKVLKAVAKKFGHDFVCDQHAIGGAALRECGEPLPAATLKAAFESDAVLLGAVGSPEFDNNPPHLKPEKALLQLRKELKVFANLRPVLLYEALVDASPLKREVVEGTDILIVRELTGGLYFGEPRGIDAQSGFNTMRYSTDEIERIAHIAFQSAQKRRKVLHSIDKANVLETSQLWRKTVIAISKHYPGVALHHMYVDNCAMQLIANPREFDVILTENMFGDILSDEAAMLTGSIGMLPSASIGGPVGLYEPIHGSAPDIAGKNIANPLAAISSVAMMLRHSFNLNEEAASIEHGISKVLNDGYRTRDLQQSGAIGTDTMGNMVVRSINNC